MALRDPDIRGPLREWIRSNRAPGLLADELPLRQGRSRVDLALIVETLHAYEIKGETDDLRRLQNQVSTFGKIVHRATIVTTRKHIKEVIENTPAWWEVLLAKRDERGDVVFTCRQRGSNNPGRDFRSVALMLHKREMLSIIKSQGKRVKNTTAKSLLVLKLQELFDDVDDLWPAVLDALLERENDPEWRHYHLKD